MRTEDELPTLEPLLLDEVESVTGLIGDELLLRIELDDDPP